jgi:glycosyltransferase involved in cell wall biosynthesis
LLSILGRNLSELSFYDMINIHSKDFFSNYTDFSILVCSYNGEFRLLKTLAYLDNLNIISGINYEVILIDNASSDNTQKIFTDFILASKNPGIYKFISVPKKGKDFALKAGLVKSLFNWIIVCDDDNLLSHDFLIKARFLIQTYSDVVAFGSKSYPVFSVQSKLPEWFNDNPLRYACGEQYPFSGYVSYKQDIWGAGSICLKSALSIALFSQDLLLSNKRGEDTELFYRLILQGSKVYYSNELVIGHCISNDRLSFENHSKMLDDDKSSKAILNKYNVFIKYYTSNNNLFLSKCKWFLFGFFRKFGLLIFYDLSKFDLMINIFTPFGNDNHFRVIKNYYKSLRYYLL